MIRVLIKTESRFPASRELIRQAVEGELVQAGIGQEQDVEIGVAVVGDRKIRQLARQFRQEDWAPAVLAFPLEAPGDEANSEVDEARLSPLLGKGFVNPPDEVLRLGDIVVSFPQAQEEARAKNKLIDEVIVSRIREATRKLLGLKE